MKIYNQKTEREELRDIGIAIVVIAMLMAIAGALVAGLIGGSLLAAAIGAAVGPLLFVVVLCAAMWWLE